MLRAKGCSWRRGTRAGLSGLSLPVPGKHLGPEGRAGPCFHDASWLLPKARPVPPRGETGMTRGLPEGQEKLGSEDPSLGLGAGDQWPEAPNHSFWKAGRG